MSPLQPLCSDAIASLDTAAFGGLCCLGHGIVVLRGAKSWNARERGFVELPMQGETLQIPIAHDERKAPFAVEPDGSEVPGFLLSLTDEEDLIACAWARVPSDSPLVGVGIDLCSAERFGRPLGRRKDLSEILLTEGERDLADRIDPENPNMARAMLFAAKEAAFKATAAPLRRWYESHDDELLYEVRHFVMEEPWRERGTGRNGAAQAAMNRMGIDHVDIRFAEVCDMALVVGLALSQEDGPSERLLR